MILRQISVFVENKKGRLAEITNVLGQNKIDIRAVCISDTKDFGILRLIVDKPDETAEILKGDGFTVALTRVIGIGISDVPGGLNRALTVLNEKDISVDYMYAFISRSDNLAYVILRVEDDVLAAEVLKANGFTMVSEENMQ